MQRTRLRPRRFNNFLMAALSMTIVAVAAGPAEADGARSRQWHLDAMHAEEMWKVSKGEGVTVAVIDTGVDSSVTDLQGQILKGKDFSGRSQDAREDSNGHGTGMAAIIAATGKFGPDRGTYGLAPEAKILPLRVTDESGSGNAAEAGEVFGREVAAAIRYAADSDARIISISQGSPGETEGLKEAVAYALSKGKLVFASVGNEGERGNPVRYPAASAGVVGVAAVDRNGNATAESEHGPQVDLAAPGADIVAACSGGSQLCESHGTSDATALASASAALIWAEHPDWTANQVIRVLVNTAGGPESGKERTDYVGYGAVRPRIALKDPGDPGDPDTNPLPGPYSENNPTPSANSSKKPADKDQQDTKGDDETEAAPASANDSDDGTSTTWAVYGLAAAGLLAAAIAIPLTRSRRRANASSAPYHQPPTPPGGREVAS